MTGIAVLTDLYHNKLLKYKRSATDTRAVKSEYVFNLKEMLELYILEVGEYPITL